MKREREKNFEQKEAEKSGGNAADYGKVICHRRMKNQIIISRYKNEDNYKRESCSPP